MSEPVLYLDLGSPYAYLAAERAEQLFGSPVAFQPILLGAIFQKRGWGSWAHTDRRQQGMVEVETRAQQYGLPPLVWPDSWPANALAADRAAIWATGQHVGDRFILALLRRQFARGEDIASVETLAAAAVDAGLEPAQLLAAIERPEVKESLRRATDEAWERGVRGVPTLRVGQQLFFGDDRLEEAAAAASRDRQYL